MNKKRLGIVVAVVLVVVAGAIAYVLYVTQPTPPATRPSGTSGAVTVTGKIGCLTPKDTSGVTDLSCAIGLMGDDGKNYALSADDPTMYGATGRHVRVKGVFTEQSSRYNSSGSIKVNSLEDI